MVYKNILDYETASEWFYYDETSPSGLRWKKSSTFRGLKNRTAGRREFKYKNGLKHKPHCYSVKLDQIAYKAHAVVWILHRKMWPESIIDHIDGNPFNNSIDNLRLATNQLNMINSKIREDNTSGIRGVNFEKKYSLWRARICFNGKSMHLGYFNDIEDAKAAYDAKAKELFGEFARSA